MNKPITEIRKAQIPSKEELEMIRDAVLLPHMLTMVERSLQEIALSTSPLRKAYAAMTEVLMNRIHADLAKVNKELRSRSIKVLKDEDRTGPDLYYKYLCRGYQDGFGIIREVAKANIATELGKYVQTIIADLN